MDFGIKVAYKIKQILNISIENTRDKTENLENIRILEINF